MCDRVQIIQTLIIVLTLFNIIAADFLFCFLLT